MTKDIRRDAKKDPTYCRAHDARSIIVVKHFAKARGGDGLPLRYDDCDMCAESIFKNLKKDFLSYAHKHGIKGFK